MTTLPAASDIELMAHRAGMTMADVCRRAGVAPSTFSRWKCGSTSPTLEIVRRLMDATHAALPRGDIGTTIMGARPTAGAV